MIKQTHNCYKTFNYYVYLMLHQNTGNGFKLIPKNILIKSKKNKKI